MNHYFNTNVVGNEEVSRTDRLSKPCNVIIVVAVVDDVDDATVYITLFTKNEQLIKNI